MLPGFSFEGKRVVVTGAASGMGKAAATMLVADGAEVHAIDVSPIDVGAAANYRVDLRDLAAVRDVASQLPARVDVLLNCAGIGPRPDPLDLALVNFLALRALTEGLLAKMESGSAVGNIASKSGGYWPSVLDDILPLLKVTQDEAALDWFRQAPGMSDPYGFTKACVIVYTLARAAELASQGIRMNAISPGAADTGFFSGADPLASPTLRAAISHVGRLSRPEEQAAPLLFLCSDAASYVSGVNVIADAGAQAGYITGRLDPPDLPPYKNIRRPAAQLA